MRNFALTRMALEDLREIAVFTGTRWGKAQRNLYLGKLDEAFHALADNPAAGRSCEQIRAGYRKFPVGSHVIYYRQAEDGLLEIVRILHKSRDVEIAGFPEP